MVMRALAVAYDEEKSREESFAWGKLNGCFVAAGWFFFPHFSVSKSNNYIRFVL